MKYLVILLLCPFLCFGQNQTNLYAGHARNCLGGYGRCLEMVNGEVDLNPSFSFTKSGNTLTLKTSSTELTQEQQVILIGKTFEDLNPEENMQFAQTVDHIFEDEECRIIGIPLFENWGILQGNYSAFIDEDGMFKIVFQINKLQL